MQDDDLDSQTDLSLKLEEAEKLILSQKKELDHFYSLMQWNRRFGLVQHRTDSQD